MSPMEMYIAGGGDPSRAPERTMEILFLAEQSAQRRRQEYVPQFTHVNDVWWYDAPLPRRWHRCRVWSTGAVDRFGLNIVERCACGAIRHRGDDAWTERNSRRKEATS